jgi:hypothetical protein
MPGYPFATERRMKGHRRAFAAIGHRFQNDVGARNRITKSATHNFAGFGGGKAAFEFVEGDDDFHSGGRAGRILHCTKAMV